MRFVCAVAFQDHLLLCSAPPDLYFVFFCSPTLIFILFTPNFCRGLSGRESGRESLQYCNLNFEMDHSFLMPVKARLRCAVTTVSEKLDSLILLLLVPSVSNVFSLTSLSFTVLSLITLVPTEFYQKASCTLLEFS